MQKLITLIITIGVIYTIFQYKFQELFNFPMSMPSQITTPDISQKKENEPIPVVQGSFLEQTLSNILVNVLKTPEGRVFFENMIQPMNKPVTDANISGVKINNNGFLNTMLSITTLGEGTIGPVSCGHIVTIKYQLTDSDKQIFEETKTYTTGAKKETRVLDSVVVGMKVGQTRHARVPTRFDKINEQSYEITVTLVDILPHNFVNETETKIFDDEIAYNQPLICGDLVTFDAKVTKIINGSIIYDSAATKKTLTMNIGNLSFPMIFSHALHGKIPIGSRTVIAKGSYFKNLKDSSNKPVSNTPLPANEYFMLELSNLKTAE